jgi:hypothetical protein
MEEKAITDLPHVIPVKSPLLCLDNSIVLISLSTYAINLFSLPEVYLNMYADASKHPLK